MQHSLVTTQPQSPPNPNGEQKAKYANLPFAMTECHCRVTLTDIEGGSHIVEVKASSLFEAIARALKLKGGSIATDGFRPIKVLVFEPKKEHEVRLKDFMAWLDRQGRSPREVIERRKISEILGVSKSARLH